MTNNTVPYLQQEYENQKTLFDSQPAIVQRFLEGQAQFIVELITKTSAQVRFSLPDRVCDSTLSNWEGQRRSPFLKQSDKSKLGAFFKGCT